MRALNAIAYVLIWTFVGVLVASVGSLAWGLLVAVNLKFAAGLPWSAAAMGGFLVLYFRYLSGAGWPARTAAARSQRLRAHHVHRRRWVLALVAGGAGTAALAGLWILLSRASGFAANTLPDTSQFSPFFSVPLLLIGSIVAPVCEEAGYRGYLQGAIEERHAAWLAIAISSLVFALAHLTHGLVWEKQLVYLLGGVVWGTTAYLTRSILPGMVSHAVTDIVFFTLVWPGDGKRAPLAADAEALLCGALVVAGAIFAVAAFQRLRVTNG